MDYDTWRTSPPEEPELHPGPHNVPLYIENAELSIDAMGVYDGDGKLDAVLIDGFEVPVADVKRALELLGVDYPGWRDDLCDITLKQLSDEAFERERSE